MESREPAPGPQPHLSVIVPLFDEGPNVVPLAREIFAALKNESSGMELILVDDASADDTARQIESLQDEDPRIRGLRHLARSGQSAALWTGMKASRGEIIATLDGDRQNDPADLPAMLAQLRQHDVVCGVRTRRQDNWRRRVSSRLARLARKAVLSVDFPDTGCNLRVFKRPVMDAILPFDGFHRFLPILAHAGGADVAFVPVTHRPRAAGQTKYGVWNRLGRGIWDLALVKWYLKRRINSVPMREISRTASRESVHGSAR
jgi:dolichol-phosphate mannosyltransferase